MSKSDLEIYHDQTIVIEGLLQHHPEFDPRSDPNFSAAEQAAFGKVFLPDWDQFANDYRQAYKHYREEESTVFWEAQAALEKFLRSYGVDSAGLLIKS